MPEGWTKIYLGKIKRDEFDNIVREVKGCWKYTENVWPGGDRKLRPQIKASRDSHGQYSIWLNASALTSLVFHLKGFKPVSNQKQDDPISLGDIPF